MHRTTSWVTQTNKRFTGEHIHRAGYGTAQPRGFHHVSPGRVFTVGGLNRCEGRAILSCDRTTPRYAKFIRKYPPAVKRGNGKKPINGGVHGTMIYKSGIVNCHLRLQEG